ncbi:HEPN domain-containing protein [Sphingobium yanoikuyae]|uniref:HEPN domain-containing protein n=1 Tax=Sphingobium yanoikuyae TaxID=13690 RepID=UPI0028DB1AA1|nr:HEPN domain-containing protein [Sphingobium yanoikuyae]
MRIGLDHLPDGKQRELAHVVEVVRAGFAKATAQRTQPRFRNGALLKIILFGSYARGDWVEDPVGRYFSDYDLLIVVNHEDLTDIAEFWEKTEAQLLADLSAGTTLRTPVSLIYHSLEDVNEKLRLGRYFFMDIVRDGIALYEAPDHPFAEPQPLSPEQALKETQDYFEEWFETAGQFYRQYEHAVADGAPNIAAFDLHQTVERLYHCLFLVRTLYSPKSHNLNRLRDLAEELEPSLKAVWPREARFEKRCYALLREAYVKARYSRSYRITEEELNWIAQRVTLLQSLVRQACESRIETLAKVA